MNLVGAWRGSAVGPNGTRGSETSLLSVRSSTASSFETSAAAGGRAGQRKRAANILSRPLELRLNSACGGAQRIATRFLSQSSLRSLHRCLGVGRAWRSHTRRTPINLFCTLVNYAAASALIPRADFGLGAHRHSEKADSNGSQGDSIGICLFLLSIGKNQRRFPILQLFSEDRPSN